MGMAIAALGLSIAGAFGLLWHMVIIDHREQMKSYER